MPYIYQALSYPLPFLGVLSVLIFIHEMGHYAMARLAGVPVQVFSIGFGRELAGVNDRAGTRWKLSLLPLGGYVRFGPAFDTSPLGARAAVMAAGPIANFLFTIVVFAVFFAMIGERFTTPEIAAVLAGTPAEAAGIKAGDRVLAIDGHAIERWEDITALVLMHPGDPLSFRLSNGAGERMVIVTPQIVDSPDPQGGIIHDVRIGIRHLGTTELVKQRPARAVIQAFREAGWLAHGTVLGLWQTLRGVRPPEKISGAISAARMTKDSADSGLANLIYFSAFLSMNIGLANLLPIPMLDGGNLSIYAIEAFTGKSTGEALQRHSLRFGVALVLTLALVGLWNDLGHILTNFLHKHFR